MKHTIAEVEAQIKKFKRMYAADKLTADEIHKLEKLPGWTWEDALHITNTRSRSVDADRIGSRSETSLMKLTQGSRKWIRNPIAPSTINYSGN